jgi:Galactose oxidase, central domain
MAATVLAMGSTSAQNLGIGTTSPHASALVDMTSNTQGLLIPRLAKAEKNAIPAPATGLMVYQTGPDSSGFHYFNGTGWVWINPNNTAMGGSLPASAIVLSETANNNALSAAGFTYNGMLRLPGATLEQTGLAAANTWLSTNTVPAPPPASGHLALFNDSVFYVWGGNAGSSNPGTGIFKYNPITDRWTNMNAVGTAPALGTAAVKVGNKWIHWGGYFYPGLSGPPAVVYDLASNTITNTSNAPTSEGLAGVAATTGNNKAYFFGGYYLSNFNVRVNQGFIYNTQNNTWQSMTTTDAPSSRYYAGMVHTNGQIMVWGDTTVSPLPTRAAYTIPLPILGWK